MKTLSPWQYVCIDVANAAGHDKLLFEERIEWTQAHIKDLESIAASVGDKDRPAYIKAVQTLRNAQKGIPSGHMVEVDASCSGIQIMSVLTGCYEGAKATGLVDPERRADAYTQTTEEMRKVLGTNFDVSRSDAKSALMTVFYGSREQPKLIFGEGTPEINAFYEAAYKVAPGPWVLIDILRDSWNAGALSHSWKLPDGYDAVVKVITEYTVENGNAARIEVDELDHSSFTYEYSVNEGKKKGLSNIANVVHSVDAYIVRTMHRMCNYDKDMVANALQALLYFKVSNSVEPVAPSDKVSYYIEQYERSSVPDVVILPYLTLDNVHQLSKEHVEHLFGMVEHMLSYEPFAMVTIHDAFKALPANINHVRQNYINVLATLANSTLLNDLLSQLYGEEVAFAKGIENLSDYIRNSQYALC